MKILSTQIRSEQPDGSKKLDPNLVVELLIKIVVLATLVWTAKTAATAASDAKQNRQFLNADRGEHYVNEAIANQRSPKK
jgi:hypothetical protein